MGTEFETAVDAVYVTFSKYARPTQFEACACCWSGEPLGDPPDPGVRGRVLAKSPGGRRPLRQLGLEELAGIVDSVPLTSGSLDLLKHYLPRILELVAQDNPDWPSIELAFCRLNDGPDLHSLPWTHWPNDEPDVLRRFFRALWVERLAAVHEDGNDVDDALCAIGLVEPDFSWYLAEWLKFDQPAAAANLVHFLDLNADDIASGRLSNAFWDHRWPADINAQMVRDWVDADTTRQAVSAAIPRARTAEESTALASIANRWN